MISRRSFLKALGIGAAATLPSYNGLAQVNELSKILVKKHIEFPDKVSLHFDDNGRYVYVLSIDKANNSYIHIYKLRVLWDISSSDYYGIFNKHGRAIRLR